MKKVFSTKTGFTLAEVATYIVKNDNNLVIQNKSNSKTARFLTKKEGDKNCKELIHLSTYPLINFKPAFTLAEVLITLGIIGIVAAMTIPNLIANAQKKSVVSGLQEAQSILNQAVKMYSYESDEEGTGDFDISLDSKAFAKKYFEPYLKVARICENMSDGCWKTENFYGYYDLGMNRKTDTIQYSLVLNNGMILGFGKIHGYNLHSIIVDINGQGRRNIMGKDVFVFYPFNSEALCKGYNEEKAKMIKNGIYPGSFDNCGVPHVIFSREDILAPNKLLRACNKDVAPDDGGRTGAGSACAALIFKDGWKISRDYPWK